MRTIWNGSINFALVNIPIGLAVAQQRKDTSLRTLHRECWTPIKQKRYCPFHERDVEADELVKGWEFAKGQFVMVEESALEAVALLRSQSIDILRFVPREGPPVVGGLLEIRGPGRCVADGLAPELGHRAPFHLRNRMQGSR